MIYKYLKISSLILLLMVLINVPGWGEITADNPQQKFYKGPPKKDPILASSLSWYIPGGGQFYSGKYTRGMIFLAAEGTLFITTLGLVSNYSYDLGNGFLMDPKSDVTKEDKQLAWGLGTILLGLHIYNIVDAYRTAKKVNLEIDNKLESENLRYLYMDRKDPFVAGLLSWKMPGLGQIYTKEYYQGSKFILGSLILKTWGIYLYQDLDEKYGKEDNGISWTELDDNDKNLVITYGLFYLTFEIINILDAINTANEYNKKNRLLYDDKIEETLSLDPKNKSIRLQLSWKF